MIPVTSHFPCEVFVEREVGFGLPGCPVACQFGRDSLASQPYFSRVKKGGRRKIRQRELHFFSVER